MPRSRSLAVAAVLAWLWLSVAGCSGLTDPFGGGPATTSPSEVAAAARPEGVPPDAEPAVVERVVDGDTVRVSPASGVAWGGDTVRVRLLNIDAPEIARDGRPGQCLADAAAARLETLLPSSSVVWLAADREERDQYDRPLRAVWTEDGVFVNALLTEEGLAEAVLFPPNDRFHASVAAAERHAAAVGVGIHGGACD